MNHLKVAKVVKVVEIVLVAVVRIVVSLYVQGIVHLLVEEQLFTNLPVVTQVAKEHALKLAKVHVHGLVLIDI